MAKDKKHVPASKSKFHVEWKSGSQKEAYDKFEDNDVLFLDGCAGVGKSYIAMAFAVSEILQGKKKNIILTRPMVSSGEEEMGFLPGTLEEKAGPYMMPLYNCLDRLVGKEGAQREMVNKSIILLPICFMRGWSFMDQICIFDEAQNATYAQLKLVLTRIGENTKLIITGDPTQSDIGEDSGFLNVIEKLESLKGIGVVHFDDVEVVRHPLIGEITKRLELQ